MTEKRFTIKPQGDLFGVVDNYSPDRVCVINGIRTKIEAEWLCKDMNTLNDENEQLKSDLDYFQRTYELEERGLDIVAPMCTIGSPTPSRLELFKENEQLKQAYTQLKHRHSLLHDECLDAECDRDSYQKDVSSLEKENEQLKSENNMLKVTIGRNEAHIKRLTEKVIGGQVHMTENKRFCVEFDDADIWEGNHFLAVAYNHHNAKKITERLNKLADENEQLKNKIKSLTIELSTHKHPLWSTREAERVVNKFKKENEELKTENHYLKNKLKRLGIIIDDVIL